MIRTMSDESDVVVEIQDTGIGMDEETVSQVFDRFYRADEAPQWWQASASAYPLRKAL